MLLRHPPKVVMASFATRPAAADDADGLRSCIESAYAVYATRGLDLPPVSEGVTDDIAIHHVWIAEADGEIVGGAILVARDSFAQLTNVAVRPEFGGRGVGRALIGRAEAECRKLNLPELRLTTHAGLPENVRLYEHLGWSETGRSGSKVHMSKRI